MGSGYDMKCSKCGYSYSRMEGIGFYFPIAYRETIEKARKEYVTVQSSVPNSYKNILLENDEMIIKEIFLSDLEEIKKLFRSVFSGPPWNEDWSDEEQLDEYMKDLIEVRGSLLFGLYEENQLIGISIGKIKHWCGGTEYFIEELCIRNELHGKGYGRQFIELIGEKIRERGLHTIYLMTDRNQPAYQFYNRLGFREIPELTSFTKDF